MPDKIINYFAEGNTAKGFYSFKNSNTDGMEHLYILSGSPGTGKSTIMTKVGARWLGMGFNVEFMHCPLQSNSVNGIIIPELKLGIIDGSEPEYFEPLNVKSAIYIDLDVALDSEVIDKNKGEIIKLDGLKRQMLKYAHELFFQALKIHDEWEKIYISNMDFNKADEITENLINVIFGNKSLDKKSVVRDRFLGAATPEGPVDFISNLTDEIEKRYFIKGRPGSGKSTLLKKIVSNVIERGFDAEVYHCGFDPDSLDMVIMRELSISIFDSTSPHEYCPEQETDEIIDMYKQTINLETDEKYSLELEDILGRYKEKISQATSFLKKAKTYNDKLEKIYASAMNFEYAERILHKIDLDISFIVE